MIERRCSLRFLFEAAHSILVSGHFWGQNLQRHFAVEPRILSQIDLAHAAGADLRDDPVMRQRGVGFEFFIHLIQSVKAL